MSASSTAVSVRLASPPFGDAGSRDAGALAGFPGTAAGGSGSIGGTWGGGGVCCTLSGLSRSLNCGADFARGISSRTLALDGLVGGVRMAARARGGALIVFRSLSGRCGPAFARAAGVQQPKVNQ